MKRRDFLKIGAGALCLSYLARSVQGEQDSSGTVTFKLFDWDDYNYDFGDEVGWIAANAYADGQRIIGQLNVEVHLENGDPDTTFYVVVYINGLYHDIEGVLTTDNNGEGNVQLALPISNYINPNDTELQVDVELY